MSTANVLLIDPKFPHNVGAALRAASCFDADGVFWTGDRVSLDVGKGQRLPREERHRDYKSTRLEHLDTFRPIDQLPGIPVAVELLPSSEDLHTFIHPDNAIYVFGPEDGSLPKGIRTACFRFVRIPSRHCLNLAAACNIVLYDRLLKRNAMFGEPMPDIAGETRGWHTSLVEQ